MIKVSMQFFALKRRLNASAGNNSALIANTIKALGGTESKIKQDNDAIYYLLEDNKQVIITPDNIKSGTYEVQVRDDDGITTESAGNYTSMDDLREVLGIKVDEPAEPVPDKKVLRAGEHYKQALLDKHEEDKAVEDEKSEEPEKPEELDWETLESARQLPPKHKPTLAASRRPIRKPARRLNSSKEMSLRGSAESASCNYGNEELKQLVLNATGECQLVGGCLFNMVDPLLNTNELFMVYEDTQDHVFVITKVDPVACGKVFNTLDEVSDFIMQAKQTPTTPTIFEEGAFDSYIPTEEVITI